MIGIEISSGYASGAVIYGNMKISRTLSLLDERQKTIIKVLTFPNDPFVLRFCNGLHVIV